MMTLDGLLESVPRIAYRGPMHLPDVTVSLHQLNPVGQLPAISRQRISLLGTAKAVGSQTEFNTIPYGIYQQLAKQSVPDQQLQHIVRNYSDYEQPHQRDQNFQAEDPHLIDFIDQHHIGLIHIPDGAQISRVRLWKQLTRAYPTAQFLFVLRRRRQAKRLQRELQQHLKEDVGLLVRRYSGLPPDSHHRVMVITLPYIASSLVNARSRQFVIVDDADQLITVRRDMTSGANDQAMKELRYLYTDRHCAKYVGVIREQHPAPLLRQLRLAIYGNDCITLTRHGAEAVPVMVWACKINGTRSPLPRELHALVNNGILKYSVRNRLMVKIARAVSTRTADSASLPIIQQLLPMIPEKPRVIVLVANVEQGLRFARQLQWPLLTGPALLPGTTENAKGVTIIPPSALKSYERLQVVTMDGLERCVRVDVLIRADGSDAGFELPLRLLRQGSGQSRSMHLVDFVDRQHPKLQRRSERRFKEYRQHGWQLMPQMPRHPGPQVASAPQEQQ